jgi:hypothetical protein
VAATSLAEYVASEFGTPVRPHLPCILMPICLNQSAEPALVQVGGLVGYKVGGTRPKVGRGTRMLYMTDRILLNEIVRDPELRDYGCVVIDEAHERSVDTGQCEGQQRGAQHDNLLLVGASSFRYPAGHPEEDGAATRGLQGEHTDGHDDADELDGRTDH